MDNNKIHWNQLSAITIVQGVMTLTWLAYVLYLPKLLVELGYSPQLARTLIIIEHLLQMAIEPIFGLLSDRQNFELGNRLPYITFGIILSSSFFLILPLAALTISPDSQWRWLLPFLAVLWASTMSIFRSPVLALLTKIAPQTQLPIAVSALTLVEQLTRSLRFFASDFILQLGALFTFSLGSFSFLVSIVFLRYMFGVSSLPPRQNTESQSLVCWIQVITIFITGICLGLGSRFLFSILPQVFTMYQGKEFVSQGMLIFGLCLAFNALPTGKLAAKYNPNKILIIALLTTAIGLLVLRQSFTLAVVILILLIINFSFATILNTIIPFVLTVIPISRAGLGIGLYLAGFGGGLSFFDLFINTQIKFDLLSLQGNICFTIASIIVYWATVKLSKK